MILILSAIFCSDYNCTLQIGSAVVHNSPNIQISDFMFYRTPNDIQDFEDLQQNLDTLKPEELDRLYNVIDEHLINKNDDHYLLLKELNNSLDNFDKICEVKQKLLNISKESYEKLEIGEDVLDQINLNRRKIYEKCYALKRNGKKYTEIIKSFINNSRLSSNKIDFYVFIFDFIEEFFDFVSDNKHKCHVKLHYHYFINHYQTYEHFIRMFINNIQIPLILFHTEKCILGETKIDKKDIEEIVIYISYLKFNISKFYNNADKILANIQKILSLTKESLKKSNLSFELINV
ncbi:uncharacterized protein VNE69_11136 [Vairimorpha necatrix]|uniref:Uncharacterized protein n=1 Tax=Vairimorpha necatrix TaxID=6039 RepID=A0AAX4JGG1_9MICR